MHICACTVHAQVTTWLIRAPCITCVANEAARKRAGFANRGSIGWERAHDSAAAAVGWGVEMRLAAVGGVAITVSKSCSTAEVQNDAV